MKDANANIWGGSRPGAGRKKGSLKPGEKRTVITSIKCTPTEIQKIKALAQKSGKSLNSFMIDMALSYKFEAAADDRSSLKSDDS